MHTKVEYIPEYAKELTYGNDMLKLSDQIHILGEQHHRLFKLKDKIDVVVHDSPFVMGLTYLNPAVFNDKVNTAYTDLATSLFDSYDNINIYIKRDVDKFEYQDYGRNQTLVEAMNKDYQILNMLDHYVKDFLVVNQGTTANQIIKFMLERNKL